MPFIVRANERVREVDPVGVQWDWIITPDRLPDRRLWVAIVAVPSGEAVTVSSQIGGLTWFQILEGRADVDGEPTDGDFIVMLSNGTSCTLVADADTHVMISQVPNADLDSEAPDRRRIDWSTEPVLLSEHDSRRRIYLASTGLWGTEAVKGEMITYPPGASGAPHHHEGAEHFQFLLSGAGVAHLGEDTVDLRTGDLLYNLENEIHAFENPHETDMVFVEFFVPGRSRTVWVPGAEACAWNPLDTDIKGRPAARRLAAHVHGQGDV